MIAVTGANGLLGSFIVRKLIEEKQDFVGLKRAGSDTTLLEDIRTKITWRDADVNDPVALDEALRDVTHVIHAAAQVSFNPRNARRIFEVNVEGTRNVVNLCLANKVSRLIHISSVSALGRVKGQTSIDETNKWVANPLHTKYAESKYLAEAEVFRGNEEGLSVALVNPSVILAPSDWTKSSSKLFKYVWDEKPFYIDGNLNYVDVRDVTRAVWQLLNSSINGERFILNAGSITFASFFEAVAKHFQKKAPRVRVNGIFLPMLAHLENLRANISNSEPLITRETTRLAGNHFRYESDKIINALGFKFQSLDETLNWCCEYYIRKYNAKK
jgi:dihydroflavonol-4-reductase